MGFAATRIVTLGICAAVVGFGGQALGFGTATARAAEPILDVDQARIGVRLSHDETAALAGGPVPAVVSMVVPLNRMGAGLHSDTRIYRDDRGGVHASLRQVISEAASHPDGTITVYMNAPGTRDGRILDVYQNWTR